MPGFALNVHAGFRCEHSGTCCCAGWAIPVEPALHERLGEAIGNGRLELGLASLPSDPFATSPPPPDGFAAVIATDRAGRCAFFEPARRLCAIHRQLGHSDLPIACQHFPRICLIDERGTFVSLSHYCPTAARLLFDGPTPLSIVRDPPVRTRGVVYEGLDACGELPPLLRPGVLTDLPGFDLWERSLVAVMGRQDLLPGQALGMLESITEEVRTWSPGSSPLVAHVDRIVARALNERGPRVPPESPWRAAVASHALVLDAVPDELRAPADAGAFEFADRRWVRDGWNAMASPLRRYLAARGFGSWLAYQGHGLRTIVYGLRVALDVVRVESARQSEQARRPLDRELLIEAIRATDLLLVHQASREALAERLSGVEGLP